MTAPDLAAARRAADELVRAGAGRGLLFRSVARGEAGLGDDSDRSKRRCVLEAKAGEIAGWPVDVVVTDAPEWAVRTTRVPCSVEARIAGDAVELADTGHHAGIDWDKEIGLPADPTAELASRFQEMTDAALRLETHLRPSLAEADAADDGDAQDHRHKQGVRFAAAMAEVLLMVESAAKITHIVTVGTAPAWRHNIADLLKSQPESVRHAFDTLAGSAIDLATLHLWRQSNYVDSRPELPSEESLKEHCTAALDIAAAAADQCRRQGVCEADLGRWDRQVGRVNDALDGPIRHSDDRSRSR